MLRECRREKCTLAWGLERTAMVIIEGGRFFQLEGKKH